MNFICENCGIRVAEPPHHKFSQTKYNRRAYPEYIDHPDNLAHLCGVCHHFKPLVKWTEAEFCQHFGIKSRSKNNFSFL